jgi:cobalt-zinc-cadmium efflux system protein
MGAGHDHTAAGPPPGPGARAGARHQRRLLACFVLVAGFLVVEAVAGILTGSLALLSDAGHMLTDVLGLGMALAAIQAASVRARRPGQGRSTFGLYRLEILAALANAVLLVGVAVWVLVEAARRLAQPPEVPGVPMLVVGLLGLVVNVVSVVLLRTGSRESLNVRGAYLEVVADALGSAGVVVAALLVWLVGWTRADLVVGAAIGLWILPRAVRLGAQAVRILLQAAPPGADLDGMRADLGAIEGVVDVHDLHLWTLTSGMENLSAHLSVAYGTDLHDTLDRARAVLRDRHEVAHATIQVEPEDHEGCEEVGW